MILVVKDNDKYYMATNAFFNGSPKEIDPCDAIDEENMNIFFNPVSKVLIGSGWNNAHFDILRYHPESFTMDVLPSNLRVAVDVLDDIESEYNISYQEDEYAPNLVFIQGKDAYQVSNKKFVNKIDEFAIISNNYDNSVELECLYKLNKNPNTIERIRESFMVFCNKRMVQTFPIVIYDSSDGSRIVIEE